MWNRKKGCREIEKHYKLSRLGRVALALELRLLWLSTKGMPLGKDWESVVPGM